MPNQSEYNTETKFSMEVKVSNNSVDYLELFKAISEKIVDKDGGIYFHSPYYFKVTDKEDIFEICKFDELPKDVKEMTPENERLKKAEKFLDECDILVADGPVYSDSGFYPKDVEKAIKIASGIV